MDRSADGSMHWILLGIGACRGGKGDDVVFAKASAG